MCLLSGEGHSQIPASPKEPVSPEIRGLKKNRARCP